jgi:hypothetical protein
MNEIEISCDVLSPVLVHGPIKSEKEPITFIITKNRIGIQRKNDIWIGIDKDIVVAILKKIAEVESK